MTSIFPKYTNVPFIRIEKILPNGESILFAASNELQEEVDFQNIFNVSSLKVKVSQFGFFASVSVPIFQQFIVNAPVMTFLEKVLTFEGKWICSFGWKGPIRNSSCSFEASLTSPNITVDPTIPGYDLTFNLQSVYTNALTSIPVGLCEKTREHVRIGLASNNLTISGILKVLFDECRSLVRDHSKINVPSQQNLYESLTVPQSNFVSNSSERYKAENIFMSTTEEDIPKLEDLLFTVVVSDSQSNEDAIKDILLNANILKSRYAEEIIKPENADTLTVWKYFCGILRDNDFLVYPTPWIGKSSKIAAFLNVNTFDGNVRELEFDGNFKTKSISEKFITTFKTEIDILKRDSGIINLNISTESGEMSMQSALAVQQLINQGNEDTYQETAFSSNSFKGSEFSGDKSAQDFRSSILNCWLHQSKKLTATLYGNTDIFIWDNLNISAYGELFSGVYKISRVDYNVTPNSFVTDIEAFQLLSGKQAISYLQNTKEADFIFFKPDEGDYPGTYSSIKPGEYTNPAYEQDITQPLDLRPLSERKTE